MISLVLVGFIAYVAFLMLLVYTMICGNNKFHRNGLIGKFYRFITITTLDWFNSTARKICPKCCFPDDDDEYNTCMGPKGPCRFFVAFFFYFIYMLFSLIYLINVYPNLYNIYGPESVELHKFLSIFVLPWPWVIFILFQFLDPGEIRNDNVESYLKIYPYDYVLYFPNLCPTLQIPVVPRSRYCRYTQKRIAYVEFFISYLHFE
ncbi:hypothetical protein TRFO_07138 [Tritrichomonas foetus]|uniref:Palmitoyltransferase n=1 Tax=Tritrichomonas foetus TaxID=1144522 RepID=A0A1J4JV52_9EUKA|nr:hypothetical protein TRFO_07138 [Tritrichomonas foetus]|eukprot:OHT02320.1 hypothetical protein TRFO_07138 [Tritrichomonas foetus]